MTFHGGGTIMSARLLNYNNVDSEINELKKKLKQTNNAKERLKIRLRIKKLEQNKLNNTKKILQRNTQKTKNTQNTQNTQNTKKKPKKKHKENNTKRNAKRNAKRKEKQRKEEQRKKSMEKQQEILQKRENEKLTMSQENKLSSNFQKQNKEKENMKIENNLSRVYQAQLEEENIIDQFKKNMDKTNLCYKLKSILKSFTNVKNDYLKTGYIFKNIETGNYKIISNNNIGNKFFNPYTYQNENPNFKFIRRQIKPNINSYNEINTILCKLFIIIGFINNYLIQDDDYILLLKGKRAIQYVLQGESQNIKTQDIDILILQKDIYKEEDILEKYRFTLKINHIIKEFFSTEINERKLTTLMIENNNITNNKLKNARQLWNSLNYSERRQRRLMNPYLMKISYRDKTREIIPLMDIDFRPLEENKKLYFENIHSSTIDLNIDENINITLLYYTQTLESMNAELNSYIQNNTLNNRNKIKLQNKKNLLKNLL